MDADRRSAQHAEECSAKTHRTVCRPLWRRGRAAGAGRRGQGCAGAGEADAGEGTADGDARGGLRRRRHGSHGGRSGGRRRRRRRRRQDQLGRLEHTPTPGEGGLPVRGVQRRQRHAVTRAGRVDEPAAAQVQRGVVDRVDRRARAFGPEEDEVAALELVAGDARLGDGSHVVGAALVHGDAVVAEVHLHHVEDEPRTVEAATLLIAVGRVLGRVLARPDVGVADVLERELGDLLLAVAEHREGHVLEVRQAVELPVARHLIAAVEHVGDLGAVDGIRRDDLVAVAVGGVVVAELELPRGDDRGQVRRRAGRPARVGLPAAGREGAQQGPVGRPVSFLEPADHHGLGRRRGHLLRRPEVPRRVRRHVAVVDGQLDDRVVAVALGHVVDLDGGDLRAVVAGGQDDGARQELSRDVALGLERRAEVVEQGVPCRAPLGHRGDVRVRPVALGHVAVRLGEGREGEGEQCRRRERCESEDVEEDSA